MILDLTTSPGEQVAKGLGDHVRFTPADVRNEAEVNAALMLADAFGALRVRQLCGHGNAFATSASTARSRSPSSRGSSRST